MKTLYFDCSMGAAGDMLAAALLDLFDDPETELAKLNAIGVPHAEYALESVTKCGIAAKHLSVLIHGHEEESSHHHDHHHDHHHASLADIEGIIGGLSLPEAVRQEMLGVYRTLGEAEAAVHGASLDSVHFHEVGMLDAVADIAAVAFLIAELAPDSIAASPVNTGAGHVHCAHGILPVPAPCTARLLEGIPAYSCGEVQGELCTPTGAALIKRLAASFGPMPPMILSKTGYGAGKKDFGKANIVRAMLGEGDACAKVALAVSGGAVHDEVCQLRCSIDDMTAEEFAYAAERIMADGALDLCMIPALMKKGRPGTVLEVLCRPCDRDAVAASVFRNTTTIGLREELISRRILRRNEEKIVTPLGAIRRKISQGDGFLRVKAEYDDVARLAKSVDSEAESRD